MSEKLSERFAEHAANVYNSASALAEDYWSQQLGKWIFLEREAILSALRLAEQPGGAGLPFGAGGLDGAGQLAGGAEIGVHGFDGGVQFGFLFSLSALGRRRLSGRKNGVRGSPRAGGRVEPQRPAWPFGAGGRNRIWDT